MAAGRWGGRRVPAGTARAVWSSKSKGTPATWIRDRLDGLFTDEDFEGSFPSDGRPRLSLAVLALVSVLQFTENLTDWQAALAVSSRIDWKYCPEMDLDDAGFDHSVLSEFRDRLAEGDRADTLLRRHGRLPERRHEPAVEADPERRSPRISVLFSRKGCRTCPDRVECTGNSDGRGRHLTLMPQLQQIQTRVRAQQDTPAWKKRYAIRAGCEATVSETVHAHGLRHCRYKGLAKTHVQHVLTALGTNIVRFFAYDPTDDHPRPARRVSHLQRLCQQMSTRLDKITNSISSVKRARDLVPGEGRVPVSRGRGRLRVRRPGGFRGELRALPFVTALKPATAPGCCALGARSIGPCPAPLHVRSPSASATLGVRFERENYAVTLDTALP